MLRRVLWTTLYGALGTGATLAARRLATKIWHIATGEKPPIKR